MLRARRSHWKLSLGKTASWPRFGQWPGGNVHSFPAAGDQKATCPSHKGVSLQAWGPHPFHLTLVQLPMGLVPGASCVWLIGGLSAGSGLPGVGQLIQATAVAAQVPDCSVGLTAAWFPAVCLCEMTKSRWMYTGPSTGPWLPAQSR